MSRDALYTETQAGRQDAFKPRSIGLSIDQFNLTTFSPSPLHCPGPVMFAQPSKLYGRIFMVVYRQYTQFYRHRAKHTGQTDGGDGTVTPRTSTQRTKWHTQVCTEWRSGQISQIQNLGLTTIAITKVE